MHYMESGCCLRLETHNVTFFITCDRGCIKERSHKRLRLSEGFFQKRFDENALDVMPLTAADHQEIVTGEVLKTKAYSVKLVIDGFAFDMVVPFVGESGPI